MTFAVRRIGGVSSADTTGDIKNSLRFRSAASAHISRTQNATVTTPLKWAWGGYVKRGSLGVNNVFLSAGSSSLAEFLAYFDTNNSIYLYQVFGSVNLTKVTTATYRDPSAHYFIFISVDTTLATAEDRVQLFINGVRVTGFSTNTIPALNTTTYMNIANTTQVIGASSRSPRDSLCDIYVSRTFFIDGGAPVSSFGYLNPETNTWVSKSQSAIKAIVDAGGANSFMLDFDDGTSLTTLGKDKSSKGNDWTLNNFSITPGVNYDWMLDTPSNNFCTLNPLNTHLTYPPKNGNLTYQSVSGSWLTSPANMQINEPAYAEFVTQSGTISMMVGIFPVTKTDLAATNTYPGGLNGGYGYYAVPGQKYLNQVATAVALAAPIGSIVGMAFNPLTGKLWVSVNGTWMGDPVADTLPMFDSISTTIKFTFAVASQNALIHANFGQRPFAYPPPAGFKSLCTRNLPKGNAAAKNPKKFFDIVLRNGFGATGGSVTGLKFKPDFLEAKARNEATGWNQIDSVRGVSKLLHSDLTNAENTVPTFLTSFNNNGYTLGSGDYTPSVTVVDYLSKAGGEAVLNNEGTIPSMVSASPESGFTIVTFNTGPTGNKTIGHGLGQAPDMWVVKGRQHGTPWWVGSSAFNLPAQSRLIFNLTNAAAIDTRLWANQTPTDTVFSIESGYTAVENSEVVAYLYSNIEGYQKVGYYGGNGLTDGPFIYCGFEPAYLEVKRVDTTGDWVVCDGVRNNFNAIVSAVYTNLTNTEESSVGLFDFVSNGFKLRGGFSNINASGGTYIFRAVAKRSFKHGNAR